MLDSNFECIVFSPRSKVAAEWVFYPNSELRRLHANPPVEFLAMDLQEGEVIRLMSLSAAKVAGSLMVKITEGQVELLNFDEDWVPCDVNEEIIWDIDRIIEAWSSD